MHAQQRCMMHAAGAVVWRWPGKQGIHPSIIHPGRRVGAVRRVKYHRAAREERDGAGEPPGRRRSDPGTAIASRSVIC